MLPKVLKTNKNVLNAKYDIKIKINNFNIELTTKQKEVLSKLNDGMLLSEARKISYSIVNKLIDKKVIDIIEEETEYKNIEIEKTVFKKLTDEQEYAYKRIIETDKTISLLFGVTGSGKTEVYLHLAKYYLSINKEVLILVPEISLTPQMIQRVKERFNDVIFYHSELSDQERYEQYKRVKKGEVKIVVGTRSSIFLPFNNLGLIIIDEEHDSSYKQDNMPCYHVKNVAYKRALDHKAKILLASATPSLDSYTRALKGEYELLKLNHRINNTLPKVQIIDLNNEKKNKSSKILSTTLIEELTSCLNNHKQAIILLNRRGYSPIIKCNECNTVLMCEDCDSPLNYHSDQKLLMCHQCGRTYNLPKYCPNCHSNSLLFYGYGTLKVEEELKSIFKDAKIDRMDRDNTYKKGSRKDILDRFGKGEIDILIGTQMIAKGLDYPNVTLVGILNADAGLMHQDYNASKMTFDLLMQASGRSGRANDPGKVVIQTYNEDHYALMATLNQDYNYFYNIEMNYRHISNYPPYSHILEIIVNDINIDRLNKSISFLDEQLSNQIIKKYKPYPLPKLKKQNRYRILLFDNNIKSLLDIVHKVVDNYLGQKNLSSIKIDIDPLYIE